MIYLYIAVGGVLGALARFGVAGWAARLGGPNLPWGTLLVNVAGAFLLGLAMQALPAWGASAETRALVAVGFCGSFTTFSTFGLEVVMLWQSGAAAAAAYVAASVLLAVGGVVAGLWLGGLIAA